MFQVLEQLGIPDGCGQVRCDLLEDLGVELGKSAHVSGTERKDSNEAVFGEQGNTKNASYILRELVAYR
ncbi:MAG: hypothetical protein BWY09_02291 [Candidatus Hydrogenedentes bacterium ADurb.Bin179]|nr:MAG: hypothetical protein BWY09_02291 [Candidatus Hydrogenedentes bacterium ADurb.Bin179]